MSSHVAAQSSSGPLQALFVQMPAQQAHPPLQQSQQQQQNQNQNQNQALPRLAARPPKPRPSILPKPAVSALPGPSAAPVLSIAPKPVAAAAAAAVAVAAAVSALPASPISRASSSTSGASPPATGPPTYSESTASASSRQKGKSASSSAPSPAKDDESPGAEADAAAAASLAQPSKQWVLPARAKPGRKPIQKGDEDEGETKRKAQNRASQRAFRERKQAHLAELEAKIESYEQQGVQQAIELQRVAQRVQAENDALKAEANTLRARNTELESQMDVIKQRVERLTAELALALRANQRHEYHQRGLVPLPSTSASAAASGYGCKPPVHEGYQRRTSAPAETAAAAPAPAAAAQPPRRNKRKRASVAASIPEDEAVGMSPVPLPLPHQDRNPEPAVASPSPNPAPTFEDSTPSADKAAHGPSGLDFGQFVHDDDCGFCADNTPCPCRDELRPPKPQSPASALTTSTAAAVGLGTGPSINSGRRGQANKKLWYTVPQSSPSRGVTDESMVKSGSVANSSDEEAVCTGDPSKCSACQRDPKLAEFCEAISTIVDGGSASGAQHSVLPFSGSRRQSLLQTVSGSIPNRIVAGPVGALPFSATSLYTSTASGTGANAPRMSRSGSISSRPRMLSSSSVPGGLSGLSPGGGGAVGSSHGFGAVGISPVSPTSPFAVQGESVSLGKRPSVPSSFALPPRPQLPLPPLSGSSGVLPLQLPPLPLLRNRGSGAGTGGSGDVGGQGSTGAPRRLWYIDKLPSGPSTSSNAATATPLPPMLSPSSLGPSNAARSSFQQSSLRGRASGGGARIVASHGAVAGGSGGALPSSSSVSHAWAQIRAHPHFPAFTGGLDLLADVVARRSGSPARVLSLSSGAAAAPDPAVATAATIGSDAISADEEASGGVTGQMLVAEGGDGSGAAGAGGARAPSDNIAAEQEGISRGVEPGDVIAEPTGDGGQRPMKRRRILVSEEGVRDALALLDGIVPPGSSSASAAGQDGPDRAAAAGDDDDAPCPCPWLKGDGAGRQGLERVIEAASQQRRSLRADEAAQADVERGASRDSMEEDGVQMREEGRDGADRLASRAV
ncbi:hypothetical protein OC834_000046 [Tilletia horrida]|nr:hypothetical protein OC834_000046 [Tilletia horrida]